MKTQMPFPARHPPHRARLLFSLAAKDKKRMPEELYSNFCLLDLTAVQIELQSEPQDSHITGGVAAVWHLERQTSLVCLHQNNKKAITLFYLCVWNKPKASLSCSVSSLKYILCVCINSECKDSL